MTTGKAMIVDCGITYLTNMSTGESVALSLVGMAVAMNKNLGS